MYQINVSTRRVTQYIIEEAYNWLYEKIVAGEYSVNRSREGKKLVLGIEEERKITEESYKKFISLFDNSPCNYMMYRSKWKNYKKITTDSLFNYFVLYNGHVLPVGFIKDFFEDDYETRKEIKVLLEEFGEGNKNDNRITWGRTLIKRDEEIDHLKNVYKPVLKVHPLLFITKLIYLAVTIGYTVILSTLFKAIELFDFLKVFITRLKFDVEGEIFAQKTIDAFYPNGEFFCEKGGSFTASEYFSAYGFFIALGLVLLLVLISRYKNIISFLIYLIRVWGTGIRLGLQKLFIGLFERKGIDKIVKYFEGIVPDLAESQHIEDEHSKGVPKEKFFYNYINKFNVKKIDSRLSKLKGRSEVSKYTYNNSNEKAVKKLWSKGIVASVVWGVILAFLMVPGLYNMVIPKILEIPPF